MESEYIHNVLHTNIKLPNFERIHLPYNPASPIRGYIQRDTDVPIFITHCSQ